MLLTKEQEQSVVKLLIEDGLVDSSLAQKT